jgi:hypothetical protein
MDSWNLRGTGVAVGVAAVIAGVGGAAVYAATDTGPRMMGTHTGGGTALGDRNGPPHNDAMRAAAPDSASLHGEYVVANGTGGFNTMISQTGRVTAISPTSVTARSDDGYSQTYVIAAAGVAATPPFAVGDEVTIEATRTGRTATVTGIGEPSISGRGQSRSPSGVTG